MSINQTISAQDLSKYITEYMHKVWRTFGKNNLHIVIDDDNVEDEHIKCCLQISIKDGDIDAEFIAAHMLTMKKTARRKAIKLAWTELYDEV